MKKIISLMIVFILSANMIFAQAAAPTNLSLKGIADWTRNFNFRLRGSGALPAIPAAGIEYLDISDNTNPIDYYSNGSSWVLKNGKTFANINGNSLMNFAARKTTVGSGNTSEPTYSFTADLDTGLYNESGKLAITTNGVSRIDFRNVDSTAMVIKNSIASEATMMKFENITPGASAYFGVDNDSGLRAFMTGGAPYSLSMLTESARPICLGTNNIERMRIAANGRVGIATTTPDRGLDVYGAGGWTSDGGIRLTGDNPGIEISDLTGGRWAILNGANTADDGYLNFYDIDTTQSRMSIAGNGNVLINSTTDDGANKLQVNGFTKLGESGTGIKMKVLTGTTGANEGDSVTVAHSIGAGKIVSISGFVEYASGSGTTTGGSTSPGFTWHLTFDNTNVYVSLSLADSEGIKSCPFTITILYKE